MEFYVNFPSSITKAYNLKIFHSAIEVNSNVCDQCYTFVKSIKCQSIESVLLVYLQVQK